MTSATASSMGSGSCAGDITTSASTTSSWWATHSMKLPGMTALLQVAPDHVIVEAAVAKAHDQLLRRSFAASSLAGCGSLAVESALGCATFATGWVGHCTANQCNGNDRENGKSWGDCCWLYGPADTWLEQNGNGSHQNHQHHHNHLNRTYDQQKLFIATAHCHSLLPLFVATAYCHSLLPLLVAMAKCNCVLPLPYFQTFQMR